MDYLGWELERQRTALTALLLGGGTAEDGGRVRDGERRSPAGPGTALGRAAGQSGRYAGEFGDAGAPANRALPARKSVRKPGAGGFPDRADRQAGAWGEPSGKGGALERGGRDAETGVSSVSEEAAREKHAEPLSGGTGAQVELSRFSGGRRAWRRGRAAGNTAEARAETAAGTDGRTGAGEWPAGKARGGGAPAGAASPGTVPGSGKAAGRLGREADARQDGPARRSDLARGAVFVRRGGGVESLGQDGLPVVRETDSAGGTGPWGGAWETAALREEDSARALSRAVQRDARRYDGGFFLY